MTVCLSRRYHQNLEDLHRAEEAMKAFSQKKRCSCSRAQIKAVIEVLAEMKARIISKEIDLKCSAPIWMKPTRTICAASANWKK